MEVKHPSFTHSFILSTLCIHSNGSYMWTQQVWNIHGFGLDSLSADDQVNVTFQLQVCNNIQTTLLPGKCNDTGAVYSVRI